MKAGLFYGGMTIAIAGAGLPLVLPSLPSSIQSGPLSSLGIFVIDYQSWIVLAGLLLVLVSVFI